MYQSYISNSNLNNNQIIENHKTLPNENKPVENISSEDNFDKSNNLLDILICEDIPSLINKNLETFPSFNSNMSVELNDS